ncbi:MAG: helix-turn-helix domain-containing protein, partial [Candidatus Dormibacteria bacterium]
REEVHGVGVSISSPRLRLELARRGWTHCDLARSAGISAPTVSAAIAGRPLAPGTVRRIAQALSMAPIVEGIDALLA